MYVYAYIIYNKYIDTPFNAINFVEFPIQQNIIIINIIIVPIFLFSIVEEWTQMRSGGFFQFAHSK